METRTDVQPAAAVPRGRISLGLAQSFAIWLLIVLAAALITHPLVPWVAVTAGVLSCVLLGKWHQRRSRPDSAVGAFTGAGLWLLLLGLLLLALNLASMALHDFE
ncbi:hypothetical protein AB0F81_43720 [Actinoplanes sp. NPDC024001]|uniref:hypothetical protein n=1 Tax=Actinoplanes sp. NPDC024001 TaxID=3154598 RepID=UPI0033F406C6